MQDLENPDELITLQRAAELSDVSWGTLHHQVVRGRLCAISCELQHQTTRRWLHAYLMSRDDILKQAAPPPDGYQAPE